jgi:cytoskeleton protein RodZ
MLDRRLTPRRTEPAAFTATGEAEPSLFDHALPSVGRDLRAAREDIGLTVEEVAAHLRIRADYLAAIEAENFEALPAPAYATGFLRSYARFVGLEPERVVAAYKTEAAPRGGKATLNFPTPLDEPRRPRGLVLVGAFLVALMVYGGWSVMRTRDRLALDYVPAPPARLTALIGTTPIIDAVPATRALTPMPVEPRGGALAAAVDQPGRSRASGIAENALVAAVAARGPAFEDATTAVRRPGTVDRMQGYLAPVTGGAVPRPAQLPAGATVGYYDLQAETAPEAAMAVAAAPLSTAVSGDDEAARPANAVQAAMTPPASPQPLPPVPAVAASEPPPSPPVAPTAASGYVPQTYGMANADSRVLLRARADSWVQVQGPNNELLLTRILRTGDTYRAPNRADIVMMTGNAGALEVIVDGRALGPLGGEGQVRRNVPLVPDQLVALVNTGQ